MICFSCSRIKWPNFFGKWFWFGERRLRFLEKGQAENPVGNAFVEVPGVYKGFLARRF